MKQRHWWSIGILASMVVAVSRAAVAEEPDDVRGVLSDLSLEELLKVQVTAATRNEQDVVNAPSVVTVFGDTEMRLFGLRTLADVLAYAPGVQTLRLPNGETATVVRGIGSENGIVVLLAGVPLLDAVTGQFNHYDMSLAGIERVEILRGPGAALYGGNANVGVINLVPKAPAAGQRGVAVHAGYPELIGGETSFTTRVSRFGDLRLTMTAEHSEGRKQHVESDAPSTLITSRKAQSLTDPANPFYVSARSEPETKSTALVQWIGVGPITANSFVSFRNLSPLFAPSYGGSRGPVSMTMEGDFRRRDLLLVNDVAWTERWEGGKAKSALRYVLNHRSQRGRITPPTFGDSWIGDTYGGEYVARGQFESYAYAQHRIGPELEFQYKLPYGNAATFGVTGAFDWVDRQWYRTNFVFFSGATGMRGLADRIAERPDYFLPPAIRRWSVGSYVQDVYSPWEWLDVVAGLRFDGFLDQGTVSERQVRQDQACRASPFGCEPKGYEHIAEHGRSYFQWSPRLAVVGKFDEDDWTGRVKLMVGQAFTPPSLASLSNRTPVERTTVVLGNPLLRPTVGRTLEGVASLGWRKQSVRLSFFYIKTKDEVVFAPNLNTYANVGNRSVSGVEAELSGAGQMSRETLELYYRSGISYQTTIAETGQLLGIAADVYPRLLYNVLLGMQWKKQLSLGLGGTYVADARREATDTRPHLPDRFLMDVNLMADDVLFKGAHAGLLVRNFFGTAYADPLSPYLGIRNDFPRGGQQVIVTVGLTETRVGTASNTQQD